jgi:membrane-associated phospholipid phosphatase
LLRPSEWIIAAYFTYAAVCAFVLPVRAGVPRTILILNSIIIGGLLLLAWAARLRHRPLLEMLRDWYALPLMLLAYREMGWLGPESHTPSLEYAWIVWDRRLLDDWGLRALIEATGPVLPSLLEISYTLVYTIAPFSMAWIYLQRRRELMDPFLVIFLSGIYSAYVLFPFFPSEPPRAVFPDADLPGVLTPFRRFNLGMLGSYGIHMSVFPSAHVSGAFSAAFGMREVIPKQVWLWRSLFVLATLIATATVYGRYHYAVDAVAGFALALAAWGVGRWVMARRSAER